MSGETLRALSRAYASGDLDREAYRRDRRALLEGIVRGEIPVHVWHAPEPEAPTVFPDEGDDGDTTQEILPAAMARDEPRRGGVPWLPIGVGVVALGAFAAVWMLLGTTDAPAPGEEPVASAPAPEYFDPFAAFLAGRDWSEERLRGLRMEWNHLAASEREAVLASDSARRMRQAALDQIAAEAALIELGDAEEALDTQEQLLDLLEHLGLADARVERARADWVAAREARLEAMAAAATAAAEVDPPADEPATATAADAEPAPAEASARETAATTEDTPPPADAPTATEAVAPPAVAADEAPPAAPAATDLQEAPAETPATPAPPAARTPEPARDAASTGSSVRSNCKPELSRKRRPYCIDILDSGIKGPVLVVLPGGEFEMGGSEPAEQPRRRVALPRPFGLGMFEVSVAELAQYCEATGVTCPAQPWDDPAYPAVNVPWQLARDYAEWLTGIMGATYRLPSEAEWEYAARAGTTTPYPFGEDIVPTDARYSFTTELTEPVAANDRSVNRNAFRLYHMLGNVREWVADAWHDSYEGAPAGAAARRGEGPRVVRGGSYADGADALRVAARLPLAPDAGDRYTGFRVLREID